MALPDLQIDDRTYDQLFAVLRKGLPTDYTDHNPSDPLITLLELFGWLGEMSLYRMNRIPAANQDRYRDLLLDSPEPVTVPVIFGVQYGAAGPHPITIAAGTRVATDYASGRRSVFETLRTMVIPVPASPAATGNQVAVLTREFLEVTDEILGTATGLPGQVIAFSPLHSRLGLAPDAPTPLLVDYVRRSGEYDPNPGIRVFRGNRSRSADPGSSFPGLVSVEFTGGELRDTTYFVSYSPPILTLIRADGVGQSLPVAAGPIPIGATEVVTFPAFQARLRLDSNFDKTVPFVPVADQATVTGGTGAIAAASLAILEVSGSVQGIVSNLIVVGPFTNPARLPLTLPTGYSGFFDGTTPGIKRVTLRDQEGNSLTLGFTLTTPFSGAETAAILRIGRLAHLVVYGAERWTPQFSLLTERTGPTSRHVRVDSMARTLQFGDGISGALPPAGAPVVCRRYQLLVGPTNLIDAAGIKHLLSPLDSLQPGDVLTVSNDEAAFGGRYFYQDEERLKAGLEEFRRPYRLVTGPDFERVLVEDFNDYQRLANRRGRVARATAVMNRTPPLATDVPAAGHVTVMVLIEDLPVAAPPLLPKIQRFLEDRRLITTRIHVIEPTFLPCQISLRFVIEVHRNATDMQARVRDALLAFFHAITGGFERRGWPLGRNVHRSEIFRLIEGIPGVDHIESLTLSPANAEGDISIQRDQLPRLQTIDAIAVRP